MNNRDESEIAVGDSARSLWPSPSRSCGHGSCPKLYGLQDFFSSRSFLHRARLRAFGGSFGVRMNLAWMIGLGFFGWVALCLLPLFSMHLAGLSSVLGSVEPVWRWCPSASRQSAWVYAALRHVARLQSWVQSPYWRGCRYSCSASAICHLIGAGLGAGCRLQSSCSGSLRPALPLCTQPGRGMRWVASFFLPHGGCTLA
jgi:hypothetical protein